MKVKYTYWQNVSSGRLYRWNKKNKLCDFFSTRADNSWLQSCLSYVSDHLDRSRWVQINRDTARNLFPKAF